MRILVGTKAAGADYADAQPTIDPMIASCRNLLIGLVLLNASGAAEAASRNARPVAATPSLEALKQQAMVFFMAKGAPNSCGPGCSEWIAAEGAFDPEAPQRLREFLALAAEKGPANFLSFQWRADRFVCAGRIPSARAADDGRRRADHSRGLSCCTDGR